MMMTRTLLYVGFSFTDEYINEIRSDVISMKDHSPKTDILAYAIMPDQTVSFCHYYDKHEGVKVLTWEFKAYGFGVADRFMETLLDMTETGAALSNSKIIFLSTPADFAGGISARTTDNELKLKTHLTQAEKSLVFERMPNLYRKFKFIQCTSLSEVERSLKLNDFLQSWVVVFVDERWNTIPTLHRDLMDFLWHPHARLAEATHDYPTTLLAWGCKEHLESSKPGVASLKQQYECYLHVKFCTDYREILDQIRRVNRKDVGREVAVEVPLHRAKSSMPSSL
eukprot:NODE_1983_length_1338_cov_24.354538_g1800_i0.p1 GENE.NODE_1983_length_1338_cov_24.354538_g1800_i0~~NODE_1983_length_1338_cov_24.354538_g1800_i0.p1  ORF type:complete len:282 (-),score=41.02 NODE_1983_length_1338_cov_24.354538_g1800_i0:302-1147(-)